MKKLVLLAVLMGTLLTWLAVRSYANNPGVRSVTLTWTEANCPTCTFNVYRGAVTGVCSNNPTPYATGITSTTYKDTAVTAGQTYIYAISAVLGVESACSAEAQIAVPPSPATPSGLQGTTN